MVAGFQPAAGGFTDLASPDRLFRERLAHKTHGAQIPLNLHRQRLTLLTWSIVLPWGWWQDFSLPLLFGFLAFPVVARIHFVGNPGGALIGFLRRLKPGLFFPPGQIFRFPAVVSTGRDLIGTALTGANALASDGICHADPPYRDGARRNRTALPRGRKTLPKKTRGRACCSILRPGHGLTRTAVFACCQLWIEVDSEVIRRLTKRAYASLWRNKSESNRRFLHCCEGGNLSPLFRMTAGALLRRAGLCRLSR